MALESKSITVHPDLEQMVISKFELFGWSLISSQEIFSQTSHTDEDAYFVYHTTKTTNYVKLMFQRERQFENREKICELEEEYWANYYDILKVPKLMPGKIFTGIFGLYLIAAVIMVASDNVDLSMGWINLVIGIAPFLLRHFLYYLPKKKKASESEARNLQIEKEIIALT